MVKLEVTLSEWLYNSIIGEQVLSINRDYFRLRKPIERRLYEIARKHCGQQPINWKISVKNLHKKVGSTATLSKFKFTLNHIIKHNHLPDYSIKMDANNVVFFLNGKETATPKAQYDDFHLKPATLEKAQKIVQQQYDIAALEAEWKACWKSTGKPELKSPDGAFINFCKKRITTEIATTHHLKKRLTVPNIKDGTKLQAWAVSNNLPVAPVGFNTVQYYRMLCKHVERINIAQEKEGK